jgi:hypothetical protein
MADSKKKRKRSRWVPLYERDGKAAFIKRGRIVMLAKCPCGHCGSDYHIQVVV